MNREITFYTLARIQALEYLTAHLLAIGYRQLDLTTDEVQSVHENLLSKASALVVPELGAALGDHYSAECEAAVRDVLDRALATLVAARRQQGP